ncbi:MAG: hypothetical protein ACXV4B_09325 [Halobacteriota archaeon]
MTDIALIWDRPLLFEKLFVEYGFAHERVSPLQIGSAYSPKFKVAILPVGFGNPAYSTVAKSVRSLGTPLQQFVREGGALVAFSPYVDDYDFAWLKLSYSFRLVVRDKPVKIDVKKQHPAAHILDVLEAHTDGYFTGVSEDDVILQSEDGAVLIVTPMGEGHIILSAIHEFPARRFIAWTLDVAQT